MQLVVDIKEIEKRIAEIVNNQYKYSKNEYDKVLAELLKDLYMAQNKMVNKTFLKSLEKNIELFAIAKSYKIVRDARVENVETFVNNEIKKIEVETEYVSHTTENIETLIEANENKKYLKYISERDGKVRPHHSAFDNITLPSNDNFWNEAYQNLSEWNCRCKIIEVDEPKDLQQQRLRANDEVDKVKKKRRVDENWKKQDSNGVYINSDDKKVNIFKENSLINELPEVIRKQYRKYE